MRHPLAVGAVGDPHGTDRSLERDAADHQRRGRGIDRQDVVRVLLVGADDGRDDLGLVAEAVGERRAQRAVGEAARQDGVLGGTALTAEERAGDLARGVRPLLDVDRQGEEVDAGADVTGGVGRGQHRCVADGGDDGTLALRRQLSGLERKRLVGPGDGSADANGISHEGLLSTPGSPPGGVGAAARFPVGNLVAPPGH